MYVPTVVSPSITRVKVGGGPFIWHFHFFLLLLYLCRRSMDLNEFNSGAGAPLLKPWLTPVVFSLEAGSIAVTGRVRQELVAGVGGHLTPYGLWGGTNEAKVSGPGPNFAMGTYIGPVAIPGTSCYRGMTTHIIVSGDLTTAMADDAKFSIRDLTGTVIHASATLPLGIATTVAVSVEFDIQILQTGAAGVALENATAIATRGANAITPAVSYLNNTQNNTTFSTTGTVEYYLYFESVQPTTNFTRRTGRATVVY